MQMNFSKFSVLSALALLATLAVCYAKDTENSSKSDAAVAEAPKTDDPASKSSEEGIKNDKPDGATTEGGTSDFDIEQLLKLIDALKNQDFDEVDRTLKESKMDTNDGPIDSAAMAEKKAADKKRFNEKMEEDKDTATSSELDEKDEL
jgi:hypothetical protein